MKTKASHMARRKAAGLTHAAVAKEFGTSRSTVGRRLKGEMMRDGYNNLGSAAETKEKRI